MLSPTATPRPAAKGRTLPRRPRRRGSVLAWVRLGATAIGLGIVVGVPAWLWASGVAGRMTEQVAELYFSRSAQAGLKVENVLVTGRQETDPDLVLATLGVQRGDPILHFDPALARQRLEGLSWVETATVERRLPDTILIHLVEREPLALWQRDGRMVLVDAKGAVLTDRTLERFAHLPLVVGPDAARNAADLLSVLSRFSELSSRVEAAVRVGGRRWDLKLDNGVTIRLPERGVEDALAWLSEIEQEEKLLDRDVVAVDLRLADRLVVQTSLASAERRRVPTLPGKRT